MFNIIHDKNDSDSEGSEGGEDSNSSVHEMYS